jgi:DNA-binding GntR family transcriptional regulator
LVNPDIVSADMHDVSDMNGTWNLPPVERLSTLEHAHRILRDAIIEGSIPPGAHLRELHLARDLATSRNTIREAIRHLVQEGLVEYVLHRGNFVSALTLADRLDVYVAREAIEVGVAKRLLDSVHPIDVRALSDALDELRRAAKGHPKPTEQVIAADLRFHQEFIRLVGSSRLDRVYETLVAETRMLLRLHPEYPWRTYVHDHETLLEAVRCRDASMPELVADHLRLSVDLIAGRAGRRRGQVATAMPSPETLI